MCDEFTAQADDEALIRKGVSRREFAAIGAAVAITACSGGDVSAAARGLVESAVSVKTPDGECDAFFVHPEKGAHPGVIYWPDIAGPRDATKVMARQLAAQGYAVLVVNQYYRGAKAPVLNTLSEWRTPEGQAKIGPLRAQLSSEAIARDAAAHVAFLDAQKAVDRKRGIGTQGYCMGGPFAIRTAAASGRVKAAASFHGGGLVTDRPDSPHRLIAGTQAAYLIAIGRNDDARAPAEKDTLREAARAAGRPAEIEVYAADHGWCVPDAPSYDQVEAERAFQRLLALYATL